MKLKRKALAILSIAIGALILCAPAWADSGVEGSWQSVTGQQTVTVTSNGDGTYSGKFMKDTPVLDQMTLTETGRTWAAGTEVWQIHSDYSGYIVEIDSDTGQTSWVHAKFTPQGDTLTVDWDYLGNGQDPSAWASEDWTRVADPEVAGGVQGAAPQDQSQGQEQTQSQDQSQGQEQTQPRDQPHSGSVGGTPPQEPTQRVSSSPTPAPVKTVALIAGTILVVGPPLLALVLSLSPFSPVVDAWEAWNGRAMVDGKPLSKSEQVERTLSAIVGAAGWFIPFLNIAKLTKLKSAVKAARTIEEVRDARRAGYVAKAPLKAYKKIIKPWEEAELVRNTVDRGSEIGERMADPEQPTVEPMPELFPHDEAEPTQTEPTRDVMLPQSRRLAGPSRDVMASKPAEPLEPHADKIGGTPWYATE
jgi:hypothetical protein